LPYHRDLYQENAPTAEIGDIQFIDYAPEPQWPVGVDAYRAAKAVKAFFIADQLDYPADRRFKMLEELLDRFELTEDLEMESLIQQSTAFQEWLMTQEILSVARKYPLRWKRDGRLFETVVDWLLETKEGLVVIQNSGFTGERKNHPKKIRELASWVKMVQTTLQNTSEKKIQAVYIHFVAAARIGRI
jgi:hypothetical protein